MATKYHVNTETGDMGKCSAKPGNCPVAGGADHFDDREEAAVRSEKILAEKYGTFKTVSHTQKLVQSIKPNEKDYYLPQTSLKHMDKAVKTLSGGPLTTKEISKAHGVVEPVANYLGNGLGYLGLVDSHIDPKTKQKVFELNENGQAYSQLPESERQEVMIGVVHKLPMAQIYQQSGDNATIDYIKKTKRRVIKETANVADERKLETIKAWVNQTTNGDNFLDENYTYQKAEEKKEIRGEVCNSCFTEKPLTGICPNCD